MENIICEQCKETFEAKKGQKRKFCSRVCASRYNGFKYPKRVSEKPTFDECINCGGEKASKFRKYCSHTCQQEHQRLEKIKKGTLGEQPLRKFLIEKRGSSCEECGVNHFNPFSLNPIVQVDHIDGDASNNDLKNLRLLCPNCHAMTPTFGALNKGNGKRIYLNKKIKKHL